MATPSSAADNSPQIPELSRRITEPRPVVIAGTIAFTLCFCIAYATRNTFGDAWIVYASGIGVGVLGAAILTVQRRAAQRGDRGAQRGLV